MSTVFTILIVLAAIALILIVLVQKSKGGGLSSGFSSTNNIMGVRKTTDFLEKTTWALAGVIIVLSIATVVVAPKSTGMKSAITPLKTMPNSSTSPDMSTGEDIPTLPLATPATSETAE